MGMHESVGEIDAAAIDPDAGKNHDLCVACRCRRSRLCPLKRLQLDDLGHSSTFPGGPGPLNVIETLNGNHG